MNETSVGVVAAICVCVAITAAAVGLRMWFVRGRPGLFGRRSGSGRRRPGLFGRRSGSGRGSSSKSGDGDSDSGCDSIHNLSLEAALGRLEGKAAQHNYAYARQYGEQHPVDEGAARLSSSELELIAEHGAGAWRFAGSEANAGVSVRGGTEIDFAGGEQALVASLQFPNAQRVYYYEVRLARVAPGTNVAVGVAMQRYPPLRLAGWARNSAAYHAGDGCVYNASPVAPAHAGVRSHGGARTGDTLGVGWRPRSGRAFFAVNGAIVGHARTPWAQKKLYPVVSADGPCSLSVNMGTRAFVLAHANMRYWAVAPPEGQRPPPPLYRCASESLLLAEERSSSSSSSSASASASAQDAPPGYDDNNNDDECAHSCPAPHSVVSMS